MSAVGAVPIAEVRKLSGLELMQGPIAGKYPRPHRHGNSTVPPHPYSLFPKSRSTSRAQLCPGAPVTPPPGWVPDPHMYRPFSGPR